MKYRESYSQNREDYIIDAFFPDISAGFYIDVGANDPHRDSVTKLFYQKGWCGVNVEPLAHKARQLERFRPRDTTLAVGLSDKPGVMTLYHYNGDGLSTFSEELRAGYREKPSENTRRVREERVPVETLANVCKNLKVKDIHFMKIDAEGSEYEVLNGNDWESFRPILLCIEANHTVRDWRPLLLDARYEIVFDDGLNEYYLASEEIDRKRFFTYPEKFLTGPEIIKWTFVRELKREQRLLRRQIRELQVRLNDIERRPTGQ